MNAAKLKGLYCKACDDETAFILNDVDDRWPWRVQCRKCGVTGKSLTAEGAVQGWIYAEGNEDPKRHLMPDPIVDDPFDDTPVDREALREMAKWFATLKVDPKVKMHWLTTRHHDRDLIDLVNKPRAGRLYDIDSEKRVVHVEACDGLIYPSSDGSSLYCLKCGHRVIGRHDNLSPVEKLKEAERSYVERTQPKGEPLVKTMFPEHHKQEAGHVERFRARLEALEENVRKLISKRTPKRFRSPGEAGNLMYPICETCRHLIKEDGCRCEV